MIEINIQPFYLLITRTNFEFQFNLPIIEAFQKK